MDIPSELSKLATKQVIALIEKNALPYLDYQIDVGPHGSAIFEHFFSNKKHDFKMMQMLCKRFRIDRIHLTGIKAEEKHIQLCSQLYLVSLHLGNIDWSTDQEEIDVPEILNAALNETSRKQLRQLDLSGTKALKATWLDYVVNNLPSLVNLGIAGRIITNEMFAQVTRTLSQLCVLNISRTGITDISSIGNLHNLEVLICHDLQILVGNIEMLSTLTKLRVLDISMVNETERSTTHDIHISLAYGIYEKSRKAISNRTTTPWPQLQALDLSWIQFGTNTNGAFVFVQTIVNAHPNLERISLWGTRLDREVVEVPGRKLKVINRPFDGSEFVALSYYANSHRPTFISNILTLISNPLEGHYIRSPTKLLKKWFRCICSSMQSYPGHFYIQDIGGATFEQLYHSRKMESFSLEDLNQMIDCCLVVLKYHQLPTGNTVNSAEEKRNIGELWMDLLKVFKNRRLLSTKGIYLFQICQFVLDSMLVIKSRKIRQLLIRIASRGLPNLIKSEVEQLTEAENYVKRLVCIVLRLETECLKQRKKPNEETTCFDDLKQALNVLSVLISDCPTAYVVFLNAGGITIGLRILKEFEHIPTHTRTLELLDNLVGQVPDGALLTEFCEPEKITLLISFMQCELNDMDCELHEKAERTYFAATLLVSLMTYMPEYWKSKIQMEVVCKQLVHVFSQFPDLKLIFIAYEFFAESFCDIVSTSESNGAIIWCLWTTLHLVKQKKKENSEYSHMKAFLESDLYPMVTEIADGHSQYIANLDNRVVQVAQQIVELVATNRDKK